MLERVPLIVVAVPAVALGAGSFLRDVPGDWSRSALLAWLAVSLAHLTAVEALLGISRDVHAVAGLLIAFTALSLGGPIGLGLLAVAFALLTAAQLAGVASASWTVCLVLAAIAAAAAWRGST